MTTKPPDLDHCPLCGGEPRWIPKGCFHQSFAIGDVTEDTVTHDFLSSLAIICLNCSLTLPSIDPGSEFEEQILAEAWNERYT